MKNHGLWGRQSCLRTRFQRVQQPVRRPGLSSLSPCQNELTMTTRLLYALGTYAVLALLAALTLEGNLRLAVWILLAGLTLKTVIAHKAGW